MCFTSGRKICPCTYPIGTKAYTMILWFMYKIRDFEARRKNSNKKRKSYFGRRKPLNIRCKLELKEKKTYSH